MSEPTRVLHPFPPLYDERSEALILGSFPSVKSRENMFFYGHPQNRFWKLLALLCGEEVPVTIEEKTDLVLSRHLALWDSIRSCTITGSSDSSVRDVVPNDLSVIIDNSRVSRVFCNGALSYNMYMKYSFPATGIRAVKLPSTSPANAMCSLEQLISIWKDNING